MTDLWHHLFSFPHLAVCATISQPARDSFFGLDHLHPLHRGWLDPLSLRLALCCIAIDTNGSHGGLDTPWVCQTATHDDIHVARVELNFLVYAFFQ